MRHIVPISGKDSLATALVARARAPELPYEYFFTDVGVELPETYAWLQKVEEATGWSIRRVGVSLLGRIQKHNGFLPSPRARYCTKECKIEPMEEMLGKEECTVYYGLRADEARIGYVPIGKPNINPVYPLRELNIDLPGVYAILEARGGLLPPDFFWPRLFAAVKDRLASWPDWESKLSRVERNVLFAGRSRGNCFLCFFQRQYEFVWLLETHPDLYAQAENLEKEEFSWMRGLPLRDLRAHHKVREVFERRLSEVCEAITRKFQRGLFSLPMDSEIALTSCGLLCGK